jgi:hypothetical protein
MTGVRILTILISAVMGACFAALAWLSIHNAIFPVRRFHIFSVVVGVVALCLVYLALRAATCAHIDEDCLLTSLRGGMFGSFIALVVIVIAITMFGDSTRGFLAHALGNPASSLTTGPVLIASAILGFGAGFVLCARGRNSVAKGSSN